MLLISRGAGTLSKWTILVSFNWKAAQFYRWRKEKKGCFSNIKKSWDIVNGYHF
jgi:hypothetical protein